MLGVLRVVRVWADQSEGVAVELEAPARLVVRQGDVTVHRQRLVREDLRPIAATDKRLSERERERERERARTFPKLGSIESAFSDMIMNSASGHSLKAIAMK